MQRRTATALIAGAGGALLARCGGKSPTHPSSQSETVASLAPVLAHYMDWATVPGQWAQASTHPLRGIYTSADTAIIGAHNAEMQSNGIWPMVSWWGPDSYAGDRFLNLYLTQAGPPLGILYEAIGQGRLPRDDRDHVDFNNPAVAAQFVAEMEHLRDTFFTGPSGGRFVRVDGRPLVFIWVAHSFMGPFEAVAARVREFAFLVGSEFTVPAVITAGHESVIRGLDAITSYEFYDSNRYPEVMDDRFLGDYVTAVRSWQNQLAGVSPQTRLMLPMTFAYDERGIPGRQGFTFRSSAETARRYAGLVRDYVVSPAAGVLPMAYATSYNEHYEGSALEPTTDPDRPDYLGILRETFTRPGP